jgi:hypothetical protein
MIEVRNQLTVQECLILMGEVEVIFLNHKSYIGGTHFDKVEIAYPALVLCKHFTNLCVEQKHHLVETKLADLEQIIVHDEDIQITVSKTFESIGYPIELLVNIKNHIGDLKAKWFEDCYSSRSDEQISGILSMFESLHDWIIAKF